MKMLGLIFLIMLLPCSGFSMKNDHAAMKANGSTINEHTHAMSAAGKTEMLSPITVDGMMAMAYVKDYGQGMTAMERGSSHHFMVIFKGSDKELLDKGTVKLSLLKKGKTIADLPLKKMDDQFGSDLALENKTVYQFQVTFDQTGGDEKNFKFLYATK